MFDNKTEYFLNLINKKCDKGNFKVISLDEFLIDFPERFYVDKESIRQMIDLLRDTGYVFIRYDSNDEVCIAPTPKGREHCEFEYNKIDENKSPNKSFTEYLYLFLTILLANLVSISFFVFIRWLYAIT